MSVEICLRCPGTSILQISNFIVTPADFFLSLLTVEEMFPLKDFSCLADFRVWNWAENTGIACFGEFIFNFRHEITRQLMHRPLFPAPKHWFVHFNEYSQWFILKLGSSGHQKIPLHSKYLTTCINKHQNRTEYRIWHLLKTSKRIRKGRCLYTFCAVSIFL